MDKNEWWLSIGNANGEASSHHLFRQEISLTRHENCYVNPNQVNFPPIAMSGDVSRIFLFAERDAATPVAVSDVDVIRDAHIGDTFSVARKGFSVPILQFEVAYAIYKSRASGAHSG